MIINNLLKFTQYTRLNLNFIEIKVLIHTFSLRLTTCGVTPTWLNDKIFHICLFTVATRFKFPKWKGGIRLGFQFILQGMADFNFAHHIMMAKPIVSDYAIQGISTQFMMAKNNCSNCAVRSKAYKPFEKRFLHWLIERRYIRNFKFIYSTPVG